MFAEKEPKLGTVTWKREYSANHLSYQWKENVNLRWKKSSYRMYTRAVCISIYLNQIAEKGYFRTPLKGKHNYKNIRYFGKKGDYWRHLLPSGQPCL